MYTDSLIFVSRETLSYGRVNKLNPNTSSPANIKIVGFIYTFTLTKRIEKLD